MGWTSFMTADVAQDLEESLRRACAPFAIVDLQTNRLAAANDAFACLLEIPTDRIQGTDLLGLLSPASRGVAESVHAAMADGMMSSCQGRAHFQLPSGAGVEVAASMHSLPDTCGTRRGLLAAGPAGAWSPDDVVGHDPSLTSGRVPDASRLALATLDHEWRFRDISSDTTACFGWHPEEYRGTPLQSVVHPDDAPLLLLALANAGAGRRGVASVLRVRSGEGVWVPVRCDVSPLCDHNPPRFALAMRVLDGEPAAASVPERLGILEDLLWRIALEIAAAGIGDSPATSEVWWGDPALRDLPHRQLDILRRLLRGERVPTIAKELFLSQSTVRNHLSAIYRRLGVHSQAELLARLIPRRHATSEPLAGRQVASI
jgi:PAS domain S-box-containing protein